MVALQWQTMQNHAVLSSSLHSFLLFTYNNSSPSQLSPKTNLTLNLTLNLALILSTKLTLTLTLNSNLEFQ